MQIDERKIDALFTQLDQCHLPGAAVGIAIGGRPVYRKGFGLANMELPIVLSPAIRMRIGSTTKHFAALAYMLLCEQGRASLDDPLGKHLPELPHIAHPVALRQLMGNVSGLRDAPDIAMRFSGTGGRITSADLLSFYGDITDVNAAPGSVWIYNNGGYVLLSHVIERITGQALEQVLRERIFEPVGMYDTMVRRFDTDFVPNSAALHMSSSAGGFEKSYYGLDFAGAGAIVSTVDDMLRWLAHMDRPVVGTAATWATMNAPSTLANGSSTGYGLGLMRTSYRGVEVLSHPGGGMGGNSQMLKVPAAGLDVVIMVNRHDVWGATLANKILDACVEGLEPIEETGTNAIASGVFQSPTTGRVIELYGKDGQQYVSIDGFDSPFVRERNGMLRPAPLWGFLKRTLTLAGDSQSPASIRFSDFGNVDKLIAAQRRPGAKLNELVGRYRSDSTGIEVTVRDTAEGPRLVTAGRFGSITCELKYMADGIWRVKRAGVIQAIDGILRFDGDGSGFRYFTYSTRSLPFHRCG